jgi:hypothetical protein
MIVNILPSPFPRLIITAEDESTPRSDDSRSSAFISVYPARQLPEIRMKRVRLHTSLQINTHPPMKLPPGSNISFFASKQTLLDALRHRRLLFLSQVAFALHIEASRLGLQKRAADCQSGRGFDVDTCAFG